MQKTICVIDDDELYQFLIKKELGKSDLVGKIQLFSDGEKALNYIVENKDNADSLPDIIFLDISMPVMNSWEFLDSYNDIKEDLSKEIKILIVSSSFDSRDIERAKEYSEISKYLIKPITRSNLIAVLKGS